MLYFPILQIEVLMNEIEHYIAQFPPHIQARLALMRATIHSAAPNASEKISYAMPTFYFNGNLVHFAGYEKHIGFYPAPSGIAHFAEELRPYKSGKGSVQFPHDQPIPVELIAQITRFRFNENKNR